MLQAQEVAEMVVMGLLLADTCASDGNGGGGGSGFVGGTEVTNTTLTAGSGATPGNSADC